MVPTFYGTHIELLSEKEKKKENEQGIKKEETNSKEVTSTLSKMP
ncbi:23772_t:CDS:1, partial [Gigaspora rosea]